MEIPNYSEIKIADLSFVKGYKEIFKKYDITTLEQALSNNVFNNLYDNEEENERRKNELEIPIMLLRAKYLGESLPNLWYLNESYEKLHKPSYKHYEEILKSLGIQHCWDLDYVTWQFRCSNDDRLIDIWKKIYEAIKSGEIRISNKSSRNKKLIHVSNAEIIRLYVEEYYRKNGVIESLKEELKSLEVVKEKLLEKLGEVEERIYIVASKMKEYIELEENHELSESEITSDINENFTLTRKK